MKKYRIGVIGAAGLVGKEILQVLADREFPVGELRLFTKAKSVGEKVTFCNETHIIEPASLDRLRGCDIAFFAGGDQASEEYACQLADSGTMVIDNSNTFRLNNDVPLVVPEVNPYAVQNHRGIIANPNCSTIQMVVALKPIQVKAGLSRVIVTTFQSVSGTGKEAVEELVTQTKSVLSDKSITQNVYPHQIAFNLIPQIGSFSTDGFCEEEWKLMLETRKILEMPDLPITATTVRIPVIRSHSESLYVETKIPIPVETIQTLYLQSPGVKLIDEPEKNKYPMPVFADGTDAVFVGRIRRDPYIPTGIHLWVVADNLRKGAALNAVQIAELITANVYA